MLRLWPVLLVLLVFVGFGNQQPQTTHITIPAIGKQKVLLANM